MTSGLFLKGKLKFIILKILNEEPLHAYAIRKRMSEKSNNLFTPSFGSLYPALEDLTKDKYLKVKTQKNKKIYYITQVGKKHLSQLKSDYKKIEKQIIRSFKDSKINLSHEEIMRLFLMHQKIASELTKEYIEDILKFAENLQKGKIKKENLTKYKRALRKSFEIMKEINKNV